jgi:hypothetical protein
MTWPNNVAPEPETYDSGASLGQFVGSILKRHPQEATG